MRLRTVLPLLSFCLLSSTAWADGGGVYKLAADKSTLKYHVEHKFHKVDGHTQKLEGGAAIKGDQVQVQIRVDVGSFDSDNGNRDEHMRETVEATKFPSATLKGLVKDFKMPATFPADVKGTLTGELEFHGVKNPLSVPVTLHFDSADHAHANSEFDISLDAYKIDRPSLMTIKIEDACHVIADVDFTK
jgi:polyisoprenoid-binding protein YceI